MSDQLTCLTRIQTLVRQLPMEHELTVNACLPYITKRYEIMDHENTQSMSVMINDILKSLNANFQSGPQYKKWVCKDVPAFSVELARFLQQANIPVEVWEYRDAEYDNVTVKTIGVVLYLYRQ